jgi:hypothetical protein
LVKRGLACAHGGNRCLDDFDDFSGDFLRDGLRGQRVADVAHLVDIEERL